MNIFDAYETDQDAEENGRWMDDSFPGSIRLKLRRFSTKKSIKVRDALYKGPIKTYKSMDKIPSELSDDLTAKHLAQGVITDWTGVFGRDGVEIPFSVERAYELFTKLPDFARAVILVSIDADNYKAEAKKEIVGNSLPSSEGSSNPPAA